MKITKITPKQALSVQKQYTFDVELMDGDQTFKVNLRACQLLDYQHFREIVLEHTGRVYGDDFYYSWHNELRTHLADYWTKQPKEEKPFKGILPTLEQIAWQPDPPQPVVEDEFHDHHQVVS
jgi:hypothetical protein